MDISVSMLIILYPTLLLWAFKSHAGVIFFAACAGLVTVGTLDVAVVAAAGAVVPFEGEAYVRLMVVLMTIGLGALLSKNSVQKNGYVVHAILSLLVGCMLWILLPSATGVSWLVSGVDNDYWLVADSFKTLVIAGSFSLSLILIPTKKQKHGKKKSVH